MNRATVTRYRQGYAVWHDGQCIDFFEYGSDGTAADCAAGAHLLARAWSRP